jgi:hypothetical protein
MLKEMSIKNKAEELNQLISKISDENQLSLIDKDVLLEKVRELYSLLHGISVTKVDNENSEIRIEEEDTSSDEHTQITDPVELPELSDEQPVSEIDKVATERASQFATSKNQTNIATLFDESVEEIPTNVDDLSTSVHEKMTNQQQDETIVEKLKQNPVEDLKKSIGINEKFSFINELFEGNLQNYNDSIEILNKELSQESALKKIEGMAETMKWDMNSATYLELHKLIQRRFK